MKAVLVDGSNQAFRLFFALPRLSAAGSPTGALAGFVELLRRLERELAPELACVVFDDLADPSARVPDHRLTLWPSYKGHRPDMDPELRAQWRPLSALCEAMGWTALTLQGFEADDALAALGTRLTAAGHEVLLVSADKDLWQLVGPTSTVLDPGKQLRVTPEVVMERFGVPPERVREVLALSGDASDGVPGVAGVGEKTAVKLVQEHGSFEAVLAAAAAGRIKGKRGEALVQEAALARLSLELVTLRVDAPVLEALGCEADGLADRLAWRGPDVEAARELAERYALRSLREVVTETPAPGPRGELPAEAIRTVTVEEAAQVEGVVRAFGKASERVVVAEFSDGPAHNASLLGLGLAWREPGGLCAAALPLVRRDLLHRALPADEVLAALGPLLEEPWVELVGSDTKALRQVLAARGFALDGVVGDVELAHYLLEPDAGDHRLGRVIAELEGREAAGLDELAAGALRVHEFMTRSLSQAGLSEVYTGIDLPLVPVLAEVESTGVGLDPAVLEALGDDLRERASAAEERVYLLAGRRFNLGSTPQLRQVLFEELGLTPTKKTATGWSTDADTLEQLGRVEGPHAELPRRILEHRHLVKLLNTYVEPLPAARGPDGRVHTRLSQTTAGTGRLASDQPNLQNIPVRTGDGRRIREAFVAAPGFVLVTADYSQVELRLLAHYAGEGALAEAFFLGQDIHRRTASEVFGVPMDAVTAEQRTASKAINFGIVYGMSAFRLAHDLAIPQREAQAMIDGTFARYPGLAAVIEGFKEEARRTGYSRTLWGRRRPVPGLHARSWTERSAAERVAVNTPIQGSAADLIRIAMVRVHGRLREELPEARLVLQVHDELLVEVPEGLAEACAALVKAEMEGSASLRVPLRVDTGWGRSWAEASHG